MGRGDQLVAFEAPDLVHSFRGAVDQVADLGYGLVLLVDQSPQCGERRQRAGKDHAAQHRVQRVEQTNVSLAQQQQRAPIGQCQALTYESPIRR